MPAHGDRKVGLGFAQARERRLQPPLADVAPRAHDVRNHVDGERFEHDQSLLPVAAGMDERRFAVRASTHATTFDVRCLRRFRGDRPHIGDNGAEPRRSQARHGPFAPLGHLLPHRRQLRRCGRRAGALRGNWRTSTASRSRCGSTTSRPSRASRPRSIRDRDDQAAAGVRVRRLAGDAAPDAPLPDVVVEAFGCGLPDRYVAAMADCARPPVWVGPRIPVRGTVDRRIPRFAVAASQAAVDALVLVPRIHARQRRPAARGRTARRARRLSRRPGRPRRRLEGGPVRRRTRKPCT